MPHTLVTRQAKLALGLQRLAHARLRSTARDMSAEVADEFGFACNGTGSTTNQTVQQWLREAPRGTT